jgi:hypothetical protein
MVGLVAGFAAVRSVSRVVMRNVWFLVLARTTKLRPHLIASVTIVNSEQKKLSNSRLSQSVKVLAQGFLQQKCGGRKSQGSVKVKEQS